MTRPAEVQVARRDGWLSNDRIRLTGLLRKGPAQAGPFYLYGPGVALERAFKAFVRRSSDARLERTVGSPRGLRFVFAQMPRAYRPDRAAGWTGDIRYELTDARGATRTWTVTCEPDRARVGEGTAPDPGLTIKLGVADFIRVAAGDLDPAKALLSGRMDLEGDFAVALRLAAMFGQPSAL
jgi:putative sterol carrier protein